MKRASKFRPRFKDFSGIVFLWLEKWTFEKVGVSQKEAKDEILLLTDVP